MKNKFFNFSWILLSLAGLFLTLLMTGCPGDSTVLPGCESCPDRCYQIPGLNQGKCSDCQTDADCKESSKPLCIDHSCLACKPNTTQDCKVSTQNACSKGVQTCQTNGTWGPCKEVSLCQEGEKCINGKCVNSSCEKGFQRCGTRCVNLKNDHDNCGKCGNKCADKEVCAEGKCDIVCPSSTPDMCQGGCFNLQTDHDHCGSCDNQCGLNQICQAGQCICAPGTLKCDKKCIPNPKTDRENCGFCGNKCADDRLCVDGKCVCVSGTHECDGKCVDFQNNAEHCGSCNNKCPAGQICRSGQCQCATNMKECNGQCTDIQKDSENCGKCGNQCPGLKQCRKGVCVCPKGTTECNGQCVDTQANRENCGQCGHKCTNGEVCSFGKCTLRCDNPKAPHLCNGVCVNTQHDQFNCGSCGIKCTDGKICQKGKCTCINQQTDCNGQCVDTQTNPNNCGSCGHQCTNGTLCQKGKCTCANGLTECQGNCTNTQIDRNNCGKCGHQCTGGTYCHKGKCQCVTGTINCHDKCIDPLNNNAHCGSCDNKCTGGKYCHQGKCECFQGRLDCKGTCIDPQKDPQNCGKCGNACPTGSACINGKCQLQCPTPLTQCGNTCANTQIDRNNCGKCGNTCKSGYICEKGKCTLSCQQGLNVCNDKCVDLQKDPQNCGKCGNQCQGKSICVKGQCKLICPSGQSVCNNQCVNLQTDNKNCGKCGNQCASNQVCTKGKCESLLFKDSKILTSKQMEQINKWIGTPSQRWILCYRLTTHGSSTSTFHARCDNRGPTVTIAHLNKGLPYERKIGGYADISWGGRNASNITSNKSFLFSLTNNFKHSLLSTPRENALYSNYSHGPTFGGGHDFVSGSSNNVGTNAYCHIGHTYACRIGSVGSNLCRNDFCGTYHPTINELEVYVRDTTNAPYFPDSTLLSKNQMTTINNWVGRPKQRWVLCYKKTNHGSKTTVFHRNCDFRGPTITIASLNQGRSNARLIGGYASVSWGLLSSSYYQTNNSFLFSLTNNFKHTIYRYQHNSLYMNSRYGPTFGGGHDFTSGYYDTIGSNVYCSLGHTYICRIGSYNSSTCQNDFCGTYRPSISELEVFSMRSDSNATFQNSLLLNKTQMQQINNWSGTPSQNWRLCYRASRDGYSSTTFHRLCDRQGPSIFVASLNTGRLIGGYANQSWGTVNNSYFGNSSSFLFSLTNNYKHSYYRYGHYLYSGNSYGPIFGGGHDAYVYGNMRTLQTHLGYSYQCRIGSYNSSTCLNDFAGGTTVSINDIEVFVKK